MIWSTVSIYRENQILMKVQLCSFKQEANLKVLAKPAHVPLASFIKLDFGRLLSTIKAFLAKLLEKLLTSINMFTKVVSKRKLNYHYDNLQKLIYLLMLALFPTKCRLQSSESRSSDSSPWMLPSRLHSNRRGWSTMCMCKQPSCWRLSGMETDYCFHWDTRQTTLPGW